MIRYRYSSNDNQTGISKQLYHAYFFQGIGKFKIQGLIHMLT